MKSTAIKRAITISLGLMCLSESVKSFAAVGTPGSGVDIVKVLGGLLIVVGAIGFTAWLMGKFSRMQTRTQSVIQVVGGVNVGNRERVVVVEVAGQWLVVGVANGQVSQLANLAKPAEGSLGNDNAQEELQTQFENIMQNQLHKSNIQHRHTDRRYRNLVHPKALPTTLLGMLQYKINNWVKWFFNL